MTFNENNLEAMRLATSMKNLSSQQLGQVTQSVGKITRFLAMMNTTANPVFIARNFLRAHLVIIPTLPATRSTRFVQRVLILSESESAFFNRQRLGPANQASGILAKLDATLSQRQAIEQQQVSGEGFTDPQQELECLCRLNAANDPY